MAIFLNTQTALVQIYVWGAGGGGGNSGGWARGSYGGGGGFASGKLVVKAGDVYQITVGGGGFARVGGEGNGYTGYTEGGGGSPVGTTGDNRYGGWGGGLSGVFLNNSYISFTALQQITQAPVYNSSTSVIIAGGGGGGGSGSKICQTTRGYALMNGGAGGGITGQRGASPGSTGILCYSQFSTTNPSGGAGGTQTAPGCPGYGPNRVQTAAVAQQFLGGKIIGAIAPYGGAGGGGWFGGGVGGYNDTPGIMAAGGGGSGYINQSLVFCGNLVTGCYATPGCNTSVYRGTAGAGGSINSTGANGRVVITYPGSQIASGGVITTSSGTTIHTFDQSGAFAIYGVGSVSTPVTLLVVGGGGGGGDNMGGGGGGGAVINAIATMTSGAYQITVGPGGNGGVAGTRPSFIGDYSSIRSLTQNSYSYLFQTLTDYMYTNHSAGDTYGYGTARVYFNAMSFNDRDFTIEGWYWLFDGTAQISRAFFTNYAAIGTAITVSSIYFGKHAQYDGLVVFWAGSINVNAPILIDPTYPPTGKWVHYAVNRSGTDFSLFRDGVAVAAATTSSAVTSGTVLANYLSLPSVAFNSINTGSYRGYMSNVRMVTGGSVYTTGVSTSSTATTFSGVFNGLYDSISVPGAIASVGTNDFNLETWVYHTTPPSFVSTVTTSVVTYVDHPNTVGAMYFNGVNNQVSFLNVSTGTFATGTGFFTFEAWIYPTTLATGLNTIATTQTPGTSNDLAWRMYWGSQQGFGVNSGSLNIVLPGDNNKLTSNTWHHVALTRTTGNLFTLWLDGAVFNSLNTNNPNFTDASLTLGNYVTWWPGYIKDVRMVKGVALYTQNTSTFSTSTGVLTIPAVPYPSIILNGTGSGYQLIDNNGTPLISTGTGITYSSLSPFSSGVSVGSVGFGSAGSSSWITLPVSSTLYNLYGDFTIEAWVYPSASITTWGIIDARVAGGSATSWLFGITNGKLTFYVGGSITSNGASVAPNVWTHVAVQRTGSTIQFYVNGVFDFYYTAQTSYPLPTYLPGATAPVIGSKDANLAGYGTPGYIASFRFVNGYALYGGQFTPPTRTLTTVTNTSTANQFLLVPDNPQTYLNDLANNAVLGQNTNVTFANVSPSPYSDGGLNFYRNASGKAELVISSGNPIPVTTVTSLTTILPYKWYHLAISRSGTTTRLFVNGVLEAINSNNPTNYSSAYPFNIGGTTRQANVQTNFTGYMHGLRLTNGLAVYTGNFTVPTSTLSTITNASTNINAITTQTVLLTLQNSTIIDNSINASVITSNGTVGIWPNTPFSTSTVFRVPTTQLTNVQSSGTNINALVLRDTAGYPGSFQFTPSNSEYLTLPIADQYAISGDFTIEAYVNMQFPPSSGLGAGIIGYGPTTGGTSLRVNSSGVLQYWLNGSTNIVTGVTPLAQNRWYHIALQRGGLSQSISQSVTTTYTTAGSLYFNGAALTRLTTPASTTLFAFGTADFTVEAWIYPTASPSNIGQIIGGHNSGSSADWLLGFFGSAAYPTTPNYMGFYGTNGSVSFFATSATPLNQWSHVAVTVTSTVPRIYLNGVLSNTGGPSQLSTIGNNIPITIGGDNTGNANAAFTGYISNLRVVKGLAVYTGSFNRPTYLLQSTQNANPAGGSNTQAISTASYTSLILNVLGSSGYITDSSSYNLAVNSANVVYNNAVVPPITTTAAGSISFSGSGQYLTVADANAFLFRLNSFTMETWVYFNGSVPTNMGVFHVASTYLPGQTGISVSYVTGSWQAQLGTNTVSTISASAGTLTANTWIHIALVRNGTVLTLYVNGIGYLVTASDTTDYNYTTNLMVGGYYNTSVLLNGSITNFRVVKNTAVYTANFTPQIPLFNINNTSLLLLANSSAAYIADSSSSPLTTAVVGAPTYSTSVPTSATTASVSTSVSVSIAPLSPTVNLYINGVLESTTGSSYSIPSSSITVGRTYTDSPSEYFNGYISNVRVSRRLIYPNFQTPTSPLKPVTRNLVSTQLLLNVPSAGSYLTDSSASANVVTATTSFLSYFTTFNGSQYLSIPSSTLFALGTNNFTIEGWVYMTAYSNCSLFGTAATSLSGYVLNLGGSNSLAFASNASGTWTNDLIVSGVGNGVPLNDWTHIAVVKNGNILTMHKNGSVVARSTGTAAWNYTAPLNTGYIGYFDDGKNPGYFTGYMSNVRVVKGVAVYPSVPVDPLTTTTGTVLLLNMSSAGSFIADSSVTGWSLTNTVSATFSAVGPPINGGGGSLVTNGTTQWLSVLGSDVVGGPFDLNLGQPDFTIECWVNLTSTFAAATRGVILQKGWNSGGSVSPQYGFIMNGPVLEYWTSASGAITGPTLVVGVWYHIAMSRIGSSIRCFLNGMVVAQVTNNGALGVGAASLFYISSRTDVIPGSPQAMNISNIRIVKGVGLYNTSTFTLPTLAFQNTQNSVKTISGQTAISAISTASYVSLLALQTNTISDSSTYASTVTQVTIPMLLQPVPFGGVSQRYAGSFNGTTQYLTIPGTVGGSTDIATGQPDWTIEAWVYLNNTTNVVVLINKDGNSGTQNGSISINIQPGGSMQFIMGNGGTSGPITSAGQSLVALRWYHIALVRQGNNMAPYINGVAGPAVSIGINMFNGGGVYTVGAAVDPTLRLALNGYISNLRIVRGIALYTSAFNTSTTVFGTTQLASVSGIPSAAIPLTTNTSVLILQDSTIIDRSVNALTIGNPAAVTMSLQTVPFNLGAGYFASFNTSTRHATVAANPVLSLGASDFTVEGWIYINAFNAAGIRAISQGTYGSGEFSFIIYVTGAFDWNESTTSVTTGSTVSSTFLLQRWQHFAITRSGSNLTTYVNGLAKATTTTSYNYSATTPIYLGGNPNSNDQMLTGAMSNVRIVKNLSVYTSNFTTSTSSLTVTQLANVNGNPSAAISTASYVSLLTLQNSSLIDNSTYGLGLSYSSTLSTSTNYALAYSSSGPYANTGSIYFPAPGPLLPGVASYLTVTNALLYPALNQDFTIELWINNSAHRGSGYYPVVFSTANSTGTSTVGSMVLYAGNSIISGATTSTYTLQINGITNNNTVSNQISIPSPIQVGIWNHIAITRASGAISVFVNGIANGVGTYFGPITSAGDNTWTIGGMSSAPNRTSFIGYISNFRVVVGAAVYSRNFAPPTNPLTISSGTYTTLLLTSSYINAGNPSSTFGYNDASLWNNISTTVTPGRPPLANGPVISILNPFNNTGSVSLLTANSPLMAVDYSPHSFNMIRSGYPSTSTFSPFYNDLPIVQTGMSSTATIAGYSVWLDGMGSKSGLVIAPYSQLHLPNDFTLEFWMYTNGGLGGPTNRYNNAMFIINKGEVQTTNISTASYQILYTYPYVYFSGFTSNNSFLGSRPDNIVASVAGTINTYYGTFNGTSQYLTTPSTANYNLGAGGDFTVECWIYVTANGNNTLLTLGTPGVSTYWFLGVNTDRSLTWQTNSGSWAWANNYTTPASQIPLNSWTHIAAVRSGSNFTMYINGSSAFSTASFNAGTGASGTLYIGTYYANVNADGSYFRGNISNLRIVKGTAVYTGNFATPPSNLTATQTANANGNPSAAITGVQTSLLTLQSATFIDNSTYVVTISNVSAATITLGFTIPIAAPNGLMGAITGPNTWNHIAVSRQGTIIRGFVNGVQGLTLSTTSTLYDTNVTGKGLAIGMGFDTTWGTAASMTTDYTGNLSNLRIIKNQALYTGNFTPPTQTLTANTVGTSGANVAGSFTGTTTLLMFHTANPLFEGTGLFTASQSYTYFAPLYPQSTNPFGPASNAATTAVAMGGGGGSSDYSAKTSPASIGANGGASAACHSVGGTAAPGLMGIPGGGYAGAVSTGTYFGAGGAGAGGSGSIGGVSTPGLGRGGSGISSSIFGTPYYFGGGGGSSSYSIAPAGSGGVGGGGGGAPKSVYGGGYGDRSSIFHAQDGGYGSLVSVANQPGGNGAPNSGGGGGGGSHQSATYGGMGGSGIVAISYPGAQKALGGVITTVGTSTVHTFYANGVFTMLAAPLYPQALGGTGGCGKAGGGGGAAGMANYGGKGGSAQSTGTAVFFGGAGTGGASTNTGFAYGGGGAGIYSAVNKTIINYANTAGSSADGALSAIVIGGGARFGGGGAGGNAAAAVPGSGCGGSGALLIVYNTTSTSYPFPNPSPVAYSQITPGYVQQYPYGLSGSTPNPSLLVLTTGTTCKSLKTVFPNFVSAGASFTYNNFSTNKNITFTSDANGPAVNVARNINAQCLNSGNIQLTTYISSHEMMMKNNDRALPVAYNTPGNYQVIQEVNKDNDPRLVNARVANFIVGVTGATASTGTAGTTVNQYWNGS